MTYRVTNLSALGVTVSWSRTEEDKHIAHDVLCFLEDRRVLFGDRHVEDELHCVHSANEARHFLTAQLTRPELKSDLAGSLRAMRLAFRRFVDSAGPRGANFNYATVQPYFGENPFFIALGELRSKVGLHVALLAYYYELGVEDELASIIAQYVEDEPGTSTH